MSVKKVATYSLPVICAGLLVALIVYLPGDTRAGEWIQDVITFNTNAAEPSGETGQLYWNLEDGTLNIAMGEPGVVTQVGLETMIYVFNDSGVDIDNGEVVRLTGSQGGQMTIAKAQSTSSPDDLCSCAGMATQDIDDGDTGYVTILGRVRGLVTTGYTEGDPVYLSTTAGAYTKTAPTAPNARVLVGFVERVGDGSGVVFVRPIFFPNLSFATDVSAASLLNGQMLVYDGVDSRFESLRLGGIPYYQEGDPSAPGDDTALVFLQSGAGTRGDAGDLVAVSTEGGSTKYTILHDHSTATAW